MAHPYDLRDLGELTQVQARDRLHPVLPIPKGIRNGLSIGDDEIHGVAKTRHRGATHETVVNDAVPAVPHEPCKQDRLIRNRALEADIVRLRTCRILGRSALHRLAYGGPLRVMQVCLFEQKLCSNRWTRA